MKGRRGGLIAIGIGLAVFLALATYPFWHAAGKAMPVPELDLETPAIRALPARLCVAPTAEMKTRHMQILDEWRTEVVRNGRRTFETPDGRRFDRSLTRTCMQCHSNKERFCDRCHDYAGVKPKCWDCHIVPETPSGEASAAVAGKGTLK
ncbi:MAG: menaquinol oxidoreductase [Deltaproteobacteria bacterium HGW-Deltaproteobacteria-19]|jgi:hypothetical protein|nr:MAG: menaquinol oxidoreductase [Deltaproteobacteria bacterium HGW-Deltaproteobacteria-19]